MRKVHFVKIRFDRRTAAITQEWFNTRIKHFEKYTLDSLLRQTDQDWVLWVNTDDEETLRQVLYASQDIGMRVPSNSQFTAGDYNLPYAEPCESVYVTRLDSDDILAPDALALAKAVVPTDTTRVEASMFCRGYMHDLRSGKTRTYMNPSPPFHTLMIPHAVWTDTTQYRRVWDWAGEHNRVRSDAPRCHNLPDYRFCVLIHGNNFISDMEYGWEPKKGVERFDIARFYAQPVTFDVDDFCDRWNCLDELYELKRVYPNFKCTLFTIPFKSSVSILEEALATGWIELAVHGFNHDPDDEMLKMPYLKVKDNLKQVDFTKYVKGFRPPCWYLTKETITACNEAGLWVAMHTRDEKYADLCVNGYYTCDDRPYWHGHTHNVCGNWLKAWLPQLKEMWPRDQAFAYVSESVRHVEAAK